jgi:hypothetical protein
MYQIRPKQPREGFSKKNIFLTDNKSDEMMAHVLDLFPKHQKSLFKGREGEMRKKALLDNVREKFNMLSEADEYGLFDGDDYADFSFKKLKRDLKKATKNVSIKNLSVANIKKGAQIAGQKTGDFLKKSAKQASLKNIGKGFQKIGNALKTAVLAVPRTAMLGLVKINFRGAASRFALLNPEGRKKLLDKFEKLGGQRGNLENAIDTGKKNKPLLCGKKCRAKAGKNPPLPTPDQAEFCNFGDPATVGLISAGLGTLTALIQAVGGKDNYKSEAELAALEAEVANEQANEDAVDATMSPQDAALADEIIKSQEAAYEPVKAIMDNPNLTSEEKQAALLDIQESIKEEGMSTTTKILIGVGILAALGLAFFLFKRKK